MADRGDPGATAVVVLAPGDRMKVAVTGMDLAARGQRVFVDGGEELHASREGLEVVPLVAERPDFRQAVGRRIVARHDVDHAVLVGAVVVVVGVAEQAFVPGPVVLGAEGIVDADEAAAGADVLAQRRLGGVEMRARRGVDRQRGIDRRGHARTACRGSCSRRSRPCNDAGWTGASRLRSSRPRSPSCSSQDFSEFCTTLPAASGGLRPAARRGPRLAWRGPAVRV